MRIAFAGGNGFDAREAPCEGQFMVTIKFEALSNCWLGGSGIQKPRVPDRG